MTKPLSDDLIKQCQKSIDEIIEERNTICAKLGWPLLKTRLEVDDDIILPG